MTSGDLSHLRMLVPHLLHRSSLLPSPRGDILEQWSHLYLCCDFYLFCPLMWCYSNVKRGVWFRTAKGGHSLHHGVRLLLLLCLFFLSFDYLFIFILLQNITPYPLVATGQRKPEKVEIILTRLSWISRHWQIFQKIHRSFRILKMEVSFSLWGKYDN